MNLRSHASRMLSPFPVLILPRCDDSRGACCSSALLRVHTPSIKRDRIRAHPDWLLWKLGGLTWCSVVRPFLYERTEPENSPAHMKRCTRHSVCSICIKINHVVRIASVVVAERGADLSQPNPSVKLLAPSAFVVRWGSGRYRAANSNAAAENSRKHPCVHRCLWPITPRTCLPCSDSTGDGVTNFCGYWS